MSADRTDFGRRPGSGAGMAGGMKRRVARAVATGRRGLGASAEEIVVAGLVAAPFAGTFGIWLSWATWAPAAAIWVATAAALVAATLWVAGHGVGVAAAPE